jgi:hypothetical protein
MNCPICKVQLQGVDLKNPPSAYPFCSERCKLIDLGRWLSGKYQIPVREPESPRPQRDLDAQDDADVN